MPGVRGANASFFLVRVLYNRTPIVAVASHVLGVLKELARRAKGRRLVSPHSFADPLPLLACTTKPICGPPMCGSPTGPIDQRKIAAFARRKPWVQIPLGPLFDCRRSKTHPPHATRAPHFAQKRSSGSIAVPQAAHACAR